MAQLRKDGQPKRAGGPRLKVRPDDARTGALPGVQGQAPYEPTDAHREMVKTYAVVLTLPQLATKIGISQTTIRKYYGPEFDEAMANAVASVGSKLFQKAINGHPASMMFFLQCRGKWTRRIEHVGADGGPIDYRQTEGYTDEQLAALEAAATILAGVDHGQPEGGIGGDQETAREIED